MSKLESFACQNGHYKLTSTVHINVKAKFFLLYNPLQVQNLSKFPKVSGAIGTNGGGIPPLATALLPEQPNFLYVSF